MIGADLYGSVLLDGLKKVFTGDPVAQNSISGWVISGLQKSMVNQSVSLHHFKTLKSFELSMRKFWEVEEVIMPQSISIEEQTCEDYFVQTYFRNPDGRYIVRLTFNSEPTLDIAKSRYIAENSLKKIELLFERNSLNKELYVNFILEYETLGHMHKVPTIDVDKPQTVYWSHHPVFRENSTTTKLSVVFHASSKTSNSLSINDRQIIGPKLQVELPFVLLHWRTYKIVFSADMMIRLECF